MKKGNSVAGKSADKPKSKVLIGYPIFGRDVPVDFCHSLVTMKFPRGVQVDVAPKSGRHIAACRESLAEDAVAGGYSHLFMLDADMSYPQNILKDFLKDDVDVVCGLSVSRYPPHWPIFGQPGKARYTYLASWPTDTKRREGRLLYGLQPTGIIGGAGALIRTSVFDVLPKPWYTHCVTYARGNGSVAEVGEDAWFTQLCRDAGIPTYCRTDMLVGHCHDTALIPRWEPLDSQDADIGRWRTDLFKTGPFYDGPSDEELAKPEFAVDGSSKNLFEEQAPLLITPGLSMEGNADG